METALIGRLTMPKDRVMYGDSNGQSYVLSPDMKEEFEAYIITQGHEIYGEFTLGRHDLSPMRERVAELVGERATGIIMSVAEYAHHNEPDVLIDINADGPR